MQKITPFLWFDTAAEEAAKYYVSIFPDSKIVSTTPGPNGSVTSVTFQLEGQDFLALNGGPHYNFSPAISFFVSCTTQDEVDTLWEKLAEGGAKLQCGWVTDKFGVTWQVIPDILGKLLHDADPAKSQRVMQAMLQMQKIDIAGLQKAHAGRGSAATLRPGEKAAGRSRLGPAAT
jgi:predicted 3-demethylubiquinone-9 3-methyltransferase (glyoxalase superfamily)